MTDTLFRRALLARAGMVVNDARFSRGASSFSGLGALGEDEWAMPFGPVQQATPVSTVAKLHEGDGDSTGLRTFTSPPLVTAEGQVIAGKGTVQVDDNGRVSYPDAWANPFTQGQNLFANTFRAPQLAPGGIGVPLAVGGALLAIGAVLYFSLRG